MGSVIGKEISAQEAADRLLKLIIDRTIVQAVFTSRSSLTAALIGVVYPAPGGSAMVKARRETTQPIFRFDPSAATSFRLDDGRAFRKGAFKSHHVSSVLSFCYSDRTKVILLELHPDGSKEDE
jgi:hypothetical protein